VAELRPHVGELRKTGAALAVIGSGWPAMAKAFAERNQLPKELSILSDPARDAYRLAGMKRTILGTFSPRALLNHLRARRKGFSQGRKAGDLWQQGGALAIATDGTVLFRHVERAPGDHVAPERLLRAVSA
jgi:hypothetical protein